MVHSTFNRKKNVRKQEDKNFPFWPTLQVVFASEQWNNLSVHHLGSAETYRGSPIK